MIEARIFTDSLNAAKTILENEEAVLKGRYAIHDTIYRSVDKRVPLIDEFLRLRVVPENIWDEKQVILAVKKTVLQTVGKESNIPLKLQFDDRESAEAYFEQHLQDQYVKDFSFERIGWQYFMTNGDVVDLEIIEDKYPSIEFKAATDEGIKRLLARFAVSDAEVITGPSVVAVKETLGLQDAKG